MTDSIIAFDPFEPGMHNGVDRVLTEAGAAKANALLRESIEAHLPGMSYTLLEEPLVETYRRAENRSYVPVRLADVDADLEAVYQDVWEQLDPDEPDIMTTEPQPGWPVK